MEASDNRAKRWFYYGMNDREKIEYLLPEYFQLKRPMWSNPRFVIDKDIVFVYAQLGNEKEKNIARITLNNKKTIEEINVWEY